MPRSPRRLERRLALVLATDRVQFGGTIWFQQHKIYSIGNGFARVAWFQVSSVEAKGAKKMQAGDVVRMPTLRRCYVWLARCR